MQLAKELLIKTRFSIIEIAIEAGYENASHFIGLFKRYYGVAPAALRKML